MKHDKKIEKQKHNKWKIENQQWKMMKTREKKTMNNYEKERKKTMKKHVHHV